MTFQEVLKLLLKHFDHGFKTLKIPRDQHVKNCQILAHLPAMSSSVIQGRQTIKSWDCQDLVINCPCCCCYYEHTFDYVSKTFTKELNSRTCLSINCYTILKSGDHRFIYCKYCRNYRPWLNVETNVLLMISDSHFIHQILPFHQQSMPRNSGPICTLLVSLVISHHSNQWH